MLLVVIPVFILLFIILIKYRENRVNTDNYKPEFADSVKLETLWWGGAIAII